MALRQTKKILPLGPKVGAESLVVLRVTFLAAHPNQDAIAVWESCSRRAMSRRKLQTIGPSELPRTSEAGIDDRVLSDDIAAIAKRGLRTSIRTP
jgi:hypothetical protein